MAGTWVDVTAVTSDEAAASSGVSDADVLLAFASAVAGTDDAALAAARATVLGALGPAALVDAAAVASNFERMVRVADATGTPLDSPLVILTESLRRDLDLDRFTTATNTRPPHPVWRLAGRLVEPLAFGLLRLAGRLRGRR
jgi:hypothetical protein